MALPSVPYTDEERRRQRREWVREVHATIGDTDHVLVVQLDDLIMDSRGRARREAGGPDSDTNRSALLPEHPEYPDGCRRLTRGPTRAPPALHVEADEFIGRQDHETRYSWPSLAVWEHDKLCSNSRLKEFLRKGLGRHGRDIAHRDRHPRQAHRDQC